MMHKNTIKINSDKNMVLYYKNNENNSFWHDVNIRTKKKVDNKIIYNYVVEVLPHTKEELKVKTNIVNNPLIINKLYDHPIPFTYGILPQTFGDSNNCDPILNIKSSDKCLSVIDITNIITNDTTTRSGQIKPVIIIGMLSLINNGKVNWQMIAVDKYVYSFNKDYIKLDNYIKQIITDWFELTSDSYVDRFWCDPSSIKRVIDFYHNVYLIHYGYKIINTK